MQFTILLVEDSSSFRQALADALLSRFDTVDVAQAANGEDALRKVEDLRPDMIFMDISLPGTNGLEATREIKLTPESGRVVILTNNDLPEYRQQAFRNGADHFISKAEDSCLRDIIARVEMAMANKRAQTWQQTTGAGPGGVSGG
jgi:DNA-binding NarL/FixJ family response regulator